MSLLANAAINGGPGPHAHLPFLAFAVAAVVAVLAGALTPHPARREGRRRWFLWSLRLAVIAVLGVATTAGLISLLSSGSASWWLVATHPWAVSGHPAAVTAGAAWFAAVITWGRGVWLGVDPPRYRDTTWSASLAVVSFVGIFIGRAGSHSSHFLAATTSAGWLLFVWFPFITMVVALIRQRDLAREVLSGNGTRPGGVWFAILAVPMFGVALIALLVAVAFGPAAPAIGRAVVAGASAIGSGIDDAAHWIGRLFPESSSTAPAPPPHGGGSPLTPPAATARASIVPSWVVVTIIVIALIVIVGALFMLVRRLGIWRSRRPPAPSDGIVEEERGSVFSWHHLRDQLRVALLGWFRRRRRHRRPQAPTGIIASAAPAANEDETVRQAYRRVLAAIRVAGHARRPSETTRELQARLVNLDSLAVAEPALGRLTDLYDAVRYGELPVDGQEASAAVEAADSADAITAGLTMG